MGNTPQSFVVTDPVSRARMLADLKRVSSAFSQDDQILYHTLRDECVRLARGQGNTETVNKMVGTLSPYLKEIKNTPVVPPQEIKVEVQDVSVAPKISSVKEPVLVHRRGPDISYASVPEVASQTEKVVPLSVKKEGEVKVISQEVKKDVPDARETLHDAIEVINDELIALGHGRAFQWLNDPETHYKEYVTDLLSVRALAQKPDGDVGELSKRIEELKVKAEMVKAVVSHHAELLPQDIVRTPEKVLAPANTEEKVVSSDVIPQEKEVIQKDVPEAAPVVSQVSSSRNYGRVDEAPLNISLKPKETAVLHKVVEKAPEVKEVVEAKAEPEEKEVLIETQLETQVDLDPLMAPEVTAGLNDLLVRWLGTSGFFGFGDSGVKHPDWFLMRHLLVEDVLHNDGTIPKGLKPETLQNLIDNIKSWREAYGLVLIERELVEHFVRRVVLAGMGQKIA